jgi:hypothetical protein
VRRVEMSEDDSGSGPVATLALASLALLAAVAIGVAVIRKRNGRYAHQQVKKTRFLLTPTPHLLGNERQYIKRRRWFSPLDVSDKKKTKHFRLH